METKEDYIAELKKSREEVRQAKLRYRLLIQKFKRRFSFMEGDRVRLTREEDGEQKEYNLYIEKVAFDEMLMDFKFTFRYITSLGKRDKRKCSIYYRKDDKIEKLNGRT